MGDVSLSDLSPLSLFNKRGFSFKFVAEIAPMTFNVLGFIGEESLFDGYQIAVDLVSEDSDVDLSALLDTQAVLILRNACEMPRTIHGVIVAVERRGASLARTYYRATLKPALHRLSYNSDSRIFQNLSVLDITRSILEEHNVIDIEWRIEAEYQPREFCVQYQETNYDFLRRLWAEEGIFFWFEHSLTNHRLIISDAPHAMPMLPGFATYTYNNRPGGIGNAAPIRRFDRIEQLRATSRAASDYTFLNPAQTLAQRSVQSAPNGKKREYELYSWPGRHKTAEVGRAYNDHALQAHRVDAALAEGETNSVRLSAGFVFRLINHPDKAANKNHRLIRVTHEGYQPVVLGEEAPADGATTYCARFTSQAAQIPYRPTNPNPRPRIDGPQIAHVTGPEGEEIYCDEYGRIKLWFPWDRRAAKDHTSSCWIRVAQNWAGGGWGHMAIPRVGNEVVVEFLNGDPDQPIVTGRTYHAANLPPYSLPENKTVMTIKSHTHRGQGYNELRFEDEAGREEVFLHAQKDHNTVIENDEHHSIAHNRAKSVGNDQSASIGNDKSESVGHDKSSTVGNDFTETVGHDVRRTVDNDVFHKVGRNQEESYGQDNTQNVGNSLKQSVFVDHLYEVGGKFEGQVSDTYMMNVGNSIAINTGRHQLMATEKFEISGPAGKITIDKNGITLEAPKIFLKGEITMGGTAVVQVPTLQVAAQKGQPFCEECAKMAEK